LSRWLNKGLDIRLKNLIARTVIRPPDSKEKSLSDNEIFHMLYHAANEPYILQEAENRQNRILDADYRNIELYPFVQELAHLTE
jgi:hypothetical protein